MKRRAVRGPVPRQRGEWVGGRLAAVAACAVAALLLALSPTVTARPVEGDAVSRHLAVARQALLMGDIDGAVRLYGEILDAHPEDLRAFWGLAGAYASAGMDGDHLVPLLEQRLRENPNDLRAKKELGTAYARLGEHERAHATWMGALHQGPPDAALYSQIGALEVRHRMLTMAAETYLEARRAFGSAALFSQELVQVYTILAEYEDALDECLIAVREHPGIVQWATNRVELMLEEGAKWREIERTIDSVARSADATPSTLSFAGSVYLVLQRPERALRAFLRADDLACEEGRMLLDFGTILKDAGQPSEALEAFRMVLERYPGSMNAAMAGVEAGRLRAELGDVEGAVTELKETGAAYAHYSAGGEALLVAAQVELDQLGDPAAALVTLDALLTESRKKGRQLVQEAGLLKVDAQLALGRFDDAYEQAESILSERTRGSVRERAMFALGFISFLKLDTAKALAEFRATVEDDVSGEFVNDALRLMLIIAEAEEDMGPVPLTLFASAQAARVAGDTAGAREHLARLADEHQGSAVAVEGLLLEGALALEAGDYAGALDVYGGVLGSTESLTARAEAMMRMGDILRDEMGTDEEAIAQYAAILEELPPNPLSGEARRKIDAIRKGRRRAG